VSHRFITELGEREHLDQVFLVSDKQLRPNRNGNLYLCMQLADRTGSVNAMMWNANEAVYRRFDNGDYVQVQGNTQHHNGALQIIVNKIDRADLGTYEEEDFVQLAPKEIDGLAGHLAEMLRGMRDEGLTGLAECFLMDEAFMEAFSSAPAGMKNHHAYQGGLLEHTVNVMELARLISPRYENVDDDLLLMGAFLHDIGKTVELTYPRDIGYSDEGQLLGHVLIAVEMLTAKATEAEKLAGEPIPPERLLRLKHMIVSHHGEYAFGAPRLPMTPEAMALHLLDNLDSKVHSFAKIMAEDVNVDSGWTSYQASLGRKLFKGN